MCVVSYLIKGLHFPQARIRRRITSFSFGTLGLPMCLKTAALILSSETLHTFNFKVMEAHLQNFMRAVSLSHLPALATYTAYSMSRDGVCWRAEVIFATSHPTNGWGQDMAKTFVSFLPIKPIPNCFLTSAESKSSTAQQSTLTYSFSQRITPGTRHKPYPGASSIKISSKIWAISCGKMPWSPISPLLTLGSSYRP